MCGLTWAIGDDVERSRAIRRASSSELRAVVDVVIPLQAEIEQWCAAHRNSTPIPEKVSVFDRLLEAVTEMQASLGDNC